MKSKKKREGERAVVEWNTRYPVGTAVSVRRDNGENFETFTTGAAAMLGGHTAVIMVDGISGCFALDRVSSIVGAGPADLGDLRVPIWNRDNPVGTIVDVSLDNGLFRTRTTSPAFLMQTFSGRRASVHVDGVSGSFGVELALVTVVNKGTL